MIKKLNNLLNQLHPGYSDISIYFRTINRIGIGVFLILVIFRPFNFTSRLVFDSVWLTAFLNTSCCYLTMLLCVIWIKLFPNLFAPERWTLRREFGIIIYQMSTIAVNIWLLNYFLGFYEFSLMSLGKTLYMVFFVGIVPYIMVTFVRHIYLMRKRLNEAIQINKKLLAKKNKLVDAVRLLNCRGLLNKIELSDFYYAESKGNDLHIFCIMEGELIEYQIRCTISSFVEDNADNPSVFRCHRSFVINIDKVLRIQGNAANYQVLLSKQLRFITVSRSYVAAFKATLVREE